MPGLWVVLCRGIKHSCIDEVRKSCRLRIAGVHQFENHPLVVVEAYYLVVLYVVSVESLLLLHPAFSCPRATDPPHRSSELQGLKCGPRFHVKRQSVSDNFGPVASRLGWQGVAGSAEKQP